MNILAGPSPRTTQILTQSQTHNTRWNQLARNGCFCTSDFDFMSVICATLLHRFQMANQVGQRLLISMNSWAVGAFRNRYLYLAARTTVREFTCVLHTIKDCIGGDSIGSGSIDSRTWIQTWSIRWCKCRNFQSTKMLEKRILVSLVSSLRWSQCFLGVKFQFFFTAPVSLMDEWLELSIKTSPFFHKYPNSCRGTCPNVTDFAYITHFFTTSRWRWTWYWRNNY